MIDDTVSDSATEFPLHAPTARLCVRVSLGRITQARRYSLRVCNNNIILNYFCIINAKKIVVFTKDKERKKNPHKDHHELIQWYVCDRCASLSGVSIP